jgi:hypothetical protein
MFNYQIDTLTMILQSRESGLVDKNFKGSLVIHIHLYYMKIIALCTDHLVLREISPNSSF